MAALKTTFGRIAWLAGSKTLLGSGSPSTTTACAEMAASFQTVFVADGVRIRAAERRRFGNSRDLLRSEWLKSGVDRRALLEMEALVENGAARSTDIETWIPSEEVASFSIEVCSGIQGVDVDPTAGVMTPKARSRAVLFFRPTFMCFHRADQ